MKENTVQITNLFAYNMSLSLARSLCLHLIWFFSMSHFLSGFESQDFDWADYLKHTGTEAAPDVCFPNVRHFLSISPRL